MHAKQYSLRLLTSGHILPAFTMFIHFTVQLYSGVTNEIMIALLQRVHSNNKMSGAQHIALHSLNQTAVTEMNGGLPEGSVARHR